MLNKSFKGKKYIYTKGMIQDGNKDLSMLYQQKVLSSPWSVLLERFKTNKKQVSNKDVFVIPDEAFEAFFWYCC